MQHDDDIHDMTEADRTSQTRFGPRPVPKGHRTASPYPHKPMKSSRIPPSGPVSPDGRSVWPIPSLAARIVVWGGVAAAAAAVSAGLVIATRKLTEDRPRHADAAPRRKSAGLAPRFADLDDDEREEMRRRARAQARADQRRAAGLRAKASRGRDAASSLTERATGLSASLNGVTDSLLSAFNGFRSVATQAGEIVAEFGAAAELVRNILQPRPPREDARPQEDDRTHRL